MRLRRPLFLASLVAVAAAAACTLNPQPLPPNDDTRATPGADAGGNFGSNDSATTTNPNNPPQDAAGSSPDGSQTGDGDAAPAPLTDGGDAGDAGDGGDGG